jgi:hypothetical protein
MNRMKTRNVKERWCDRLQDGGPWARIRQLSKSARVDALQLVGLNALTGAPEFAPLDPAAVQGM